MDGLRVKVKLISFVWQVGAVFQGFGKSEPGWKWDRNVMSSRGGLRLQYVEHKSVL